MVEELIRTNLSWAEHSMSPLRSPLSRFTALSVEKSLFIFNEVSVIEWNGTSWETLEGLCRNRFWHTTVVYAGEIYHMGGHSEHVLSPDTSPQLFR